MSRHTNARLNATIPVFSHPETQLEIDLKVITSVIMKVLRVNSVRLHQITYVPTMNLKKTCVAIVFYCQFTYSLHSVSHLLICKNYTLIKQPFIVTNS